MPKFLFGSILLLIASTAFYSCKTRESSLLEATGDFSRQDLAQLNSFLNRYCTECHTAETGSGGFGFVEDLSRLRSSSLVVPGEPEKSQLWKRVVGAKSDPDSRMPPEYAEKQVGNEGELEIITKWIAAGAPSGVASNIREIISDAAMLKMIFDDLSRLPATKRQTTRYLSLINLFNTVKEEEYAVSDKRLASYRFGVSKFVNSLSWVPKITPPEIVPGSNGTLLRIDLRNYSVDARTVGLTHLNSGRSVGLSVEAWDKLSGLDPYRIEYKGEVPEQIRRLTGTTFPIMRADFFVFKAGVGSPYYEIMGIEGNLSELEKSLLGGLTSSDRVRQRKPIIRSGFTNSGVSKHNRLIERHDISLYRNAAYWISYDFAGTVAKQQLSANPLGPQSAFDNQDRVFRHDGGEAIFNLPNGMQAYVLTDNQGNLLSEGPVNIVQDPKRTVIKNAISCMDCHSVGMIKKSDQIRAIAEANQDIFNAAQLEFIRYAHPRTDYANNLLETSFNRDTARYRGAADAAKIANESVDLDSIEPVSDLHDYFIDTEVTLPMAAAEVGMSEQEFLATLQQKPNLRIILGNFFLQGGGSVKRETFKDLFPQIVRELELDRVRDKIDVSDVDSGGGGRVTCKAEIVKSGSNYKKVLEHTAASTVTCEKEVLEKCEGIIQPVKSQGYECRIAN